MPALEDIQLEQFSQDAARNLLKGMPRGKAATAAARSAGYKGSSLAANARKRINRADVKRRMIELVAPKTEEAEAEIAHSADDLRKRLFKIALHPIPDSKVKVSDQVAAAGLIARMDGLLAPEKREHSGPNGSSLLNGLDRETATLLIAQLTAARSKQASPATTKPEGT